MSGWKYTIPQSGALKLGIFITSQAHQHEATSETIHDVYTEQRESKRRRPRRCVINTGIGHDGGGAKAGRFGAAVRFLGRKRPLVRCRRAHHACHLASAALRVLRASVLSSYC